MMTPRDAEYKQAEIFRKMTADEKVDVMVGMWNLAHEINQSGWYGSKSKTDSRHSDT
ncbi:hypothetical protein HZA87_02545 [Candidatus Uhrbacteria bacterium]|nr:hypothetical protein [Candidatus Uhrbacteria bacterium]